MAMGDLRSRAAGSFAGSRGRQGLKNRAPLLEARTRRRAPGQDRNLARSTYWPTSPMDVRLVVLGLRDPQRYGGATGGRPCPSPPALCRAPYRWGSLKPRTTSRTSFRPACGIASIPTEPLHRAGHWPCDQCPASCGYESGRSNRGGDPPALRPDGRSLVTWCGPGPQPNSHGSRTSARIE